MTEFDQKNQVVAGPQTNIGVVNVTVSPGEKVDLGAGVDGKPTIRSGERFTWLHLTDLHWGADWSKGHWREVTEPLVEDVAKWIKKHQTNIDVIFFTGDLVQRGTAKEFGGVNQVFRYLRDKISKKIGRPFEPQFLAIPGNHDLQRPKISTKSFSASAPVSALIDRWDNDSKVRELFWDRDKTLFSVVTKAFKAYQKWWRDFDIFPKPENCQVGILPGEFAVSLKCGEHKIGIVGLNSALLQLGSKNYKGLLDLHRSQLSRFDEGYDEFFDGNVTNILLTHHPLDWFSQRGKDAYDVIMHPQKCCFHLCGHMHENNLSRWSNNGEDDERRCFQAASLMGMDGFNIYDGNQEQNEKKRSHGYSLGVLSFSQGKVMARVWPRVIPPGQPSPYKYFPDNRLKPKEDGATEAVKVASYTIPPTPVSHTPHQNTSPQDNPISHIHKKVVLNIQNQLNASDMKALKECFESAIQEKYSDIAEGVDPLQYLLDKAAQDVVPAIRLLRIAIRDSRKLCSDKQRKIDIGNAGETILGWLLLLMVRENWVSEYRASAKQITEIRLCAREAATREVAVARLNEHAAQFNFEAENRPIPGINYVDTNPIGFENVNVEDEANKVILNIWNKVFPSDTRQLIGFPTGEEDYEALDSTIEERREYGEAIYIKVDQHHYEDGDRFDADVYNFVFRKLPNLQRLIVRTNDEQDVIMISETKLCVQIQEFFRVKNAI